MPASSEPSDLLAPAGELEPALFPLLTVQALADQLAAWLDAGYTAAVAAGLTDTDDKADRAAVAFTYYRAFDSALQRIIASPTTSSLVDKGSSSYSTKQLDILQGKVNRWLDEYNVLITPDDAPVTNASPSGFQPARFVY